MLTLIYHNSERNCSFTKKTSLANNENFERNSRIIKYSKTAIEEHIIQTIRHRLI
ncbi:hypothetical protein T08_5021 [Trichinella sp. T8]|nr:hypothetical protein T08_5021 [Trichinella sp. T8]